MVLRADKESWGPDECGPSWILDDDDNYLAELIMSDSAGKCRDPEDMEVIGALMGRAPDLACHLQQALGMLLMCASFHTRPDSSTRRKMLSMVDSGRALFEEIGVIFTDQEEAAVGIKSSS